MSRNNGRDYIYLVWKDYNTRQRFIIGELSKNGLYQFKYNIDDINKAVEKGFEPLIAFPNLQNTYESKEIFPAFSSRLPDRRRKDIIEILNKYKLDKYEAFELLKKSGGKLPTDSLEFIDPIFLEEENIEREFYVAEVRHYDFCKKADEDVFANLCTNDALRLEKDSNNSFDKYAVKILNNQNKSIGYIPNFFSREVTNAIDCKREVICSVINIDCSDTCEECVKVKLCIS